jgi:sulfur carrier protein ThiS
MKVFIEKGNKYVDVKPSTGEGVLMQLSIPSTTVLIVRNNEIVLPEDELSEGDEVKLLSVISGG